MSSKGQDKTKALRRWLAEERAHSIALDRMLLRESRRHKTQRKQFRIGRSGQRGR